MNIAQWTHCPFCGAVEGEYPEYNAYECGACTRRIYENIAASTVMVFYTTDGRVLMSERAHAPEKGKYDFPGGFVDPRETAGEAMLRELSEELGVTLARAEIDLWMSAPNVYTTDKGLQTHVLDIVFLCCVSEDFIATLVPADDVAAVHLVDPCTVPDEQIAFESVHTVIRAFCQERIWEN